MILRTITCDVCGNSATETTPGEGWPGWGALQGIKLNGVDNPNLCPKHLAAAANALDKSDAEVVQ
jgi:hypothetical protein